MVHRSRVAPEIHQIVSNAYGSGRAKILKGTVSRIATDNEGRVLAVLNLLQKEPVEQSFDYVINCSGPNMSKPLPFTIFVSSRRTHIILLI